MPLLKLLTFYKCLLQIFFKVKVAQIFSSWKLKGIIWEIYYICYNISQMYKPEYIPRVYLPYIISSQSILFFFSNVNSILSILLYIIKPVSKSLQLQQNPSFFFSSIYYISLNLLKCLLYIIKPMSNSLHLHARPVYKKL